MLRLGRHPVGIQPDKQLDRLDENRFRELGQGQPVSGAAETRGVGLGTEAADAAVRLPERFEAFEDGLGLMKN